ncbi:enoyl-CoA hydratase/isomerase family protein [Aeromicrobium panaciterrae]|uniref:enoyl-CoA hydratase/isomerase family protein n=1 Tax=Aeromicrobium panaciterrae TaxID=363861 RepID=UPI0031D1878D
MNAAPVVVVESLEDRVVIRLNRPEARNAVNQAMVSMLHQVCAELEELPRVALIIGEGTTFAAGADIGELRARGHLDALSGINSAIFDRIRRLPMPTIGLLDGYALGGGAELAYACDFRIGTPRTRIGNPEPGLGIIAAAGAVWRLGELVGEPFAKEILLAGRVLKADEAREVRLLNDIVDPGELEAAGHALADRIVGQSALAVRLSKSLFHAPRGAHPLIDDIAQAVLFETEDKRTRMTAFLDRSTKD